MGKMKIANAFNPPRRPKPVAQGNAGYDNPRENIDPHIRTKAVSTKEVTLSDGTGAGYVMNDANGVLSGGNAGGGGGTGDVTAAVNLTDETLTQGDGGAKGIKTTTVTAAQVAANTLKISYTDAAAVGLNTAKNTNVSTNLSAGTRTATTIDVNSSDGTNATLVEADTTNAGILGSDKWDEIVANSVHSADNTQAHTDYLLNSGADSAVGPLTITADNSTADQAYVPMILYNTDENPPAASGFPVGTLYVQYTA